MHATRKINPAGRRCLKVIEVADELAIGPRKVFQLIASGDIKAVRIGKSTRVTRESLEEYLRRVET